MLQKTQQELDQIYSATESIMSTSSRLSKSLSRDSQHLFLGSTEPVLRNSVMISIDTQRLSSSVESSDRSTEKDDSRCSQQNPFSETSWSVFNKTRETRVLSRPAICWIHYVQIALSISAILKNAQQCSTMFNNALKHSDMLINAQ